jgi:hypothetical protein
VICQVYVFVVLPNLHYVEGSEFLSGFASLAKHSCKLMDIVAYRFFAKRWLYKQRPFLGNGSVNTFPLLGSIFLIMQQLDYNNRNGVFYMWSALRSYKQGT